MKTLRRSFCPEQPGPPPNKKVLCVAQSPTLYKSGCLHRQTQNIGPNSNNLGQRCRVIMCSSIARRIWICQCLFPQQMQVAMSAAAQHNSLWSEKPCGRMRSSPAPATTATAATTSTTTTIIILLLLLLLQYSLRSSVNHSLTRRPRPISFSLR